MSKRKHSKPQAPVIGLAWYDEFQYARLLELAVDAESMPDTYETWLSRVDDAERGLRAANQAWLRIPVDMGDLERWCAKHDRKNDGRARSAYVAERVQELHKPTPLADRIDTHLFVILLSNSADATITTQLIHDHVEYLKRLDAKGRLVLCGPFLDHPGGMIVIRAGDTDDATTIANLDPFVRSGAKTAEIRTWVMANSKNDYLQEHP